MEIPLVPPRVALCFLVFLVSYGCSGRVAGGVECVPGSCGPGRTCHAGECVDTCNADWDCRPGYACTEGICLPGERQRAGACALPPIHVVEAPSSPHDVGFAVEALGALGEVDSSCPAETRWLVCDAPEDSSYFTTEQGGCLLLTEEDALTFYPDRRGTYRLVYEGTGPGGVTHQSIPLSVTADLLFLEVKHEDSSFFVDALLSALAADTCHSNVTETSCTAAAGCVWHHELGLCWTHCEERDEATCELDNLDTSTACLWEPGDGSEPPSCAAPPLEFASPVLLTTRCFARASMETCVEIPECRWRDNHDFCSPACELFTTEDCPTTGCFPTLIGECLDGFVASMPSPAMVYADGSSPTFLRVGPTGYRYDPNNKFPNPDILGSGMSAAAAGMDSLPTAQAAVLPYSYIFEYHNPADDTGACGRGQTMLFWQQGNTPGYPSLVEELTPPISDGIAGVDPPRVSQRAAFPSMAANNDGRVRVAFGVVDEPSSDLSPCRVRDYNRYESEHAQAALGTSLHGGTLATYIPMQVMMAEVFEGNFLRAPLEAVPGAYPCRSDGDCPEPFTCDSSGAYGQCKVPCSSVPNDSACGAGACEPHLYCSTNCGEDEVCPGRGQVEAYLPRLHDGGDTIVFSHMSCAGGHGTACISESGRQHDLIVGRVERTLTGFHLTQAQFLTDTPKIIEIDPVVVGSLLGNASIYYMGLKQSPLVLATDAPGGSTAAMIEWADIHRRNITYSSGAWIMVQSPAEPSDVVIPGFRLPPEPLEPGEFYCPLGNNNYVLESVRTVRPAHLTASPDGSVLAVAGFIQDHACRRTGGFFSSVRPYALLPELPHESVVYVVDASDPTVELHPAHNETCESSLHGLSLMPTFIANGRQLVFTNRRFPFGGDQLLRLNVEDVLNGSAAASPMCNLTQIMDDAAIAAELEKIQPGLAPSGVGLEGSRSYFSINITICSATGDGSFPWEMLILAALTWRLMRRRRKFA